MTPSDERVAEPDTAARDPEIERLLQGRLHEPRNVLGLHSAGAGNVVVRVLKPDATRIF